VELRHLRYFAAVADTCHFGRAADRLHMAQPALSQAIRQLEAELGASLFTRTTRQVSLTPAGEFLLEEARRVLRTVDESTAGVRRVAAGRKGLARLGFTGTAAFTQLPFIARTLRQELPEVALEIHGDLLTPDQCEGLRQGTLDLAVLRPPVVGEGLVVRTIEVEPLLLALPADHPLAERRDLELAELRTEGFVLYRAAAINEAALRACRDAGFTPRREQEASSTAVLLALVAAGLGVALVPGSARVVPLDGVVFRDVAGAGTVELALAWREEPSELVGSVLAVLQDAGLFERHATATTRTEGAR
jgi:DNA-binding transcriptional LysR family regulator